MHCARVRQTVKNVSNQKNLEILTDTLLYRIIERQTKRNREKSHYLPDASICKYALAASSTTIFGFLHINVSCLLALESPYQLKEPWPNQFMEIQVGVGGHFFEKFNDY